MLTLFTGAMPPKSSGQQYVDELEAAANELFLDASECLVLGDEERVITLTTEAHKMKALAKDAKAQLENEYLRLSRKRPRKNMTPAAQAEYELKKALRLQKFAARRPGRTICKQLASHCKALQDLYKKQEYAQVLHRASCGLGA